MPLTLDTSRQLRSLNELAELGQAISSAPLTESEPDWLAPHIIDQHRAETLEELYRALVDECQSQIGYIISFLADCSAVWAIIHCSAGKDRTGVVVAVLLALVGVERDTIVEDYLQTKRYLNPIKSELRSAAAQIGYNLERLDRMLECRADAIKGALEYIDEKYDGTPEYVRAVGIEESAIGRLRSVLVENGLTRPSPNGRPLQPRSTGLSAPAAWAGAGRYRWNWAASPT